MKGLLQVALALALLVALASAKMCGKVQVNSQQEYGRPLALSWSSFDSAENPVVKYEWGVVTATQAASAHGKLCGVGNLFWGIPDTVAWRPVSPTEFRLHSIKASLNEKWSVGSKYHAAVQAVLQDGSILTALSQPFEVTPQVLQVVTEEEPVVHVNARSFGLNTPTSFHDHECVIDRDNACRGVDIAQLLMDRYGQPEWRQRLLPFREYYEFVNFNNDDEYTDGSSHGFPVGAVLGIAFGVAGLVLLAALIAAILGALLGGDSEDKYKSNVHRQTNYEEF